VLDHPLVPGKTSAIEKGPWHYGADYIAVYFDADVSKLSSLVPRPFEVETGSSMAYACEIVSVSDSEPEMVYSHPDRTVYQEAALGVACKYGTKRGIFFPVMWVTTEWSLLRGLLNGYQKRLADRISLTKVHPLNPGLRAVGPGSSFSAFSVKGAQTTLSLSVEVQKQGSPSDLPAYGATFGLRRFPATDGSQESVDEPVEISKSNSRVSDVWLGKGSVQTTLEIGRPRSLRGAVYRSGFTISGSKVLRR
jgi:Acetoacetate decarboxylase (ADC)